MQDTAKFWNGVADRYAARPIGDMEAYEYTLGRTRSYLGTSDTVLELGCGTGSTAILLAPHVRRIVASDISTRMTEIGQARARDQKIDNAEFRAADIHDPAFDGETYDAVLAFNLLHLVPDLDAALARIAKLTRPGGMFISKSALKPAGFSLKFTALRVALPLMQMIGKAPFVALRGQQEFEAAITRAGFDIVETGNHPAGPPPARYVVARRRG